MNHTLHLINPMLQVSGAELHTVEVFRILAKHGDVTLWGHRRAPQAIRQLVPITIVEPLKMR